MSSRRLRHSIEDEEKGSLEALEVHHRIPDGRLITTVQVCLRCGRKFTYKRGRKRCPRCLGPLIIKTMVLKAP
ncbi:hypothetical protein KAU93_00535, partial [Candidatus Bathyarchaeota archaeon]|nr:hypothetical protein [Candidatus Bathyarchaeota archaeon]